MRTIVILIPILVTIITNFAINQTYASERLTNYLNTSEDIADGKEVTVAEKKYIYSKNDFIEGLILGIEIPFNLFTAYHIGSAPHEGVHGLFGYILGAEPDDYIIKPYVQGVSFALTNDEQSRLSRFATNLSAPIFTRATLNLPRWIYTPDQSNYWHRWSSSFYVMMQSTLWVTLAGTWIQYIGNYEPDAFDYSNASTIIDSRVGRGVFVGFLTGLMAFDFFQTQPIFTHSFRVMIGLEKEVDLPPVRSIFTSVNFSIAPNYFTLNYNF